jgi:cyclopropane fatty-acyl-phospholipid synthase-like methyltransferase
MHDEVGNTNGLTLIFYLLERSKFTLAILPCVVAWVAMKVYGGGILAFLGFLLAIPTFGIFLPIGGLVAKSWWVSRGSPTAEIDEYIDFKDSDIRERFKGKKMPMCDLYEGYMARKLDFKKDPYETLLHRYELFRMCLVPADVEHYFNTFLAQATIHTKNMDKGEIAHVYDRGNDFYNWFLGEAMVYTSGVFHDPTETLEQGQDRKLHTVCKYVHMKKGDQHLDIGCGWGTLLAHAAKHYGTFSTGVTLAKEQAAFGRQRAKDYGVANRVEILVRDYRDLPARRYDCITCLEMAEHVGIKNFQNFLLQVRSMLKDDGIFYLQIAGLRRHWQYEDLVWGLFMNKYIFPAADASCPLGFVVNQCERAGFEVHRVENCGVHYSLTIKKWYDNWVKNRDKVVEKYGEYWYRMWVIFLAWSAIIAAQGSSTVFFITLTKNHCCDKRSVADENAEPFSRMDTWVGKDVIATQQ